jgi:hypothetical protein
MSIFKPKNPGTNGGSLTAGERTINQFGQRQPSSSSRTDFSLLI